MPVLGLTCLAGRLECNVDPEMLGTRYLDPENFRRVFKVTFEVLADTLPSRKDLVYL